MFSKLLYTFLFLATVTALQAQNRISLQAGWTHSNIRGQWAEEFQGVDGLPGMTDFKPHNTAHASVEYEHYFKNWTLGTGVAIQTMGGTIDDDAYFFYPTPTWRSTYVAVPILAGYQLKISEQTALHFRGGVELSALVSSELETGIELDPTIHVTPFQLNALADIAVSWKRFKVGGRLHWGVTDFLSWANSLEYRHTGVTTYLNYTLWDQQKTKAYRAAQF